MAASFAAEEVWRGGDGMRLAAPAAASRRRGGARLEHAERKNRMTVKNRIGWEPKGDISLNPRLRFH
jgi:hypothetical protein